MHNAATAYRKGRSIFDNAKAHVENRFLLRMDMQEFFPSLTVDDMDTYKRMRPNLFKGWTDQDFKWFCFLVFRFDRLTIGAPTSPAMSNALCFDLDVTLDGICQLRGVTYTRYADDLFFSADESGALADVEQEVKTAVAKLTLPGTLRINDTKTRHSSKKGARRVTGIVLGSDGIVYVGRHLKREVRSQVYKLDSLAPKDRARLAGMISYITGFDPEFMNALVLKYGHPRAIRARDGKP